MLNDDEKKIHARAAVRRWYWKNCEKVAEYGKEYRAKTKEKRSLYAKSRLKIVERRLISITGNGMLEILEREWRITTFNVQ